MIALILIASISNTLFNNIIGLSNSGDSPFELMGILVCLIYLNMDMKFK